jgi:hypothetical protein
MQTAQWRLFRRSREPVAASEFTTTDAERTWHNFYLYIEGFLLENLIRIDKFGDQYLDGMCLCSSNGVLTSPLNCDVV